MALSSWSTTPASNATALGIDIGEGCDAANINDAIRILMAQIKVKVDAIDAALGVTPQPLDATLTALAGVTSGADKLPYFTGTDTVSTTTLSSFARTLLDDTSAALALATLGAQPAIGFSSAGNALILTILASDGHTIKVEIGSGTAAANSASTVSFVSTFTTRAKFIASGGRTTGGAGGSVYGYGNSLSAGNIVNSDGIANAFGYLVIGY